jgi:hypothetical protein
MNERYFLLSPSGEGRGRFSVFAKLSSIFRPTASLLYILITMSLLLSGCAGSISVKAASSQKQKSYFPQDKYEKDFVFPPIMGPLTLTGKMDYEKDSPGLGYSTKYTDNIASMEIFVYDSQNKFIPDDINSPFVLRAFREAAGDIISLGGKGKLLRLKHSEGRTIILSGKYMYLIPFEFAQDNLEKFGVLMLSVHKGKFFKVWLTIEKGKDADYVDDSIRLLEEVTGNMLLDDVAPKHLI